MQNGMFLNGSCSALAFSIIFLFTVQKSSKLPAANVAWEYVLKTGAQSHSQTSSKGEPSETNGVAPQPRDTSAPRHLSPETPRPQDTSAPRHLSPETPQPRDTSALRHLSPRHLSPETPQPSTLRLLSPETPLWHYVCKTYIA